MGLIEKVWEQTTVESFVVFSAGSFIAYVLVSRFHENRKLHRLGVPGPKLNSSWPFGVDFIFHAIHDTVTHQTYQNWHNLFQTVPRTSPTGATHVLGQRIVFTHDPENIKAILATQFADYGKGELFHRHWRDFLGDSIFTTDGPAWHASRQLIRPLFVKDRVGDLRCFEEHVGTLFRAVGNGGPLRGEGQVVDAEGGEGEGGRVVDVSDLFFRFSLDVTTDFLLGSDVKSLTTPKNPFAEGFDEVQRVQNLITRAGKAAGLIPRFSFWAGLRIINRFVNQYIERALRLSPEELSSKTKSDTGYTFVHALASFTRDRTVLRDQLVAILLAGRDTSASSLSWTMYELARRPEIVRRLRAEILHRLGPDRTPTYEDLKSMTYLRHILNESLRLYPAVPFNVRLALHDTTLPRGGGPDGTQPLPVLKDTPVGYSVLAMQRDPSLYPPVSEDFPAPDVFCPERWEKWHPKAHHFIPFNAGPRICVGQRFAMTQMGYVLCRMFQRYERVESRMEEVDGGEPCLRAEITLRPGQGVKVVFFEAKNP